MVVALDHTDLDLHAFWLLPNGENLYNTELKTLIPGGDELFSILRWASILGINMDRHIVPGTSDMGTLVKGCACAYDLELDLSSCPDGMFPLVSTPILSATIVCSCSWMLVLSACETMYPGAEMCENVPHLTSCLLEAITEHCPLWLVGWNNYVFDNVCIAFHCVDGNKERLRPMRVGSSRRGGSGFIIDTPGVYNIDWYLYLDKTS
jgi:hypothetical protein